MLGMAIFFIRHEHVELFRIWHQFRYADPFYLAFGGLLTIIYILLQAGMYVESFRSLDASIPLGTATSLFLKRNLISVFLPAGGFSSLAFFSKEIEKRGVTKSKIHLASSVYALCGLLSVVIVAIPILFYTLLHNQLRTPELLGFVFLILLTGFLIVLLISLLHKGWAYNLIQKRNPAWTVVIEEMSAQSIRQKYFLYTLLLSAIIELVGVAHLYISMKALGYEPSLMAAFIGYIVMVILLIASPFLRGLGAIEVSLTFILTQYGLPVTAAASIVLLFRLFEFWLPLLAGIGSFIARPNNLILRIMPAIIILILGIINIISAITPAIPVRLRLVEGLLPEDLIIASNGLVLVSGLILVLLSVFLLQGSKRAWYIALVITGLSAIGHMLKAIDFEEATYALLAAVALIASRKNYKLKPHPRFSRLSLQVIIYGLLAVLVYGVLGFYFIDKKHFGHNFELIPSIKAVLRIFFLFDDTGISPRTHFGRNFLYSLYAAGSGYLIFVFFGLLRSYFAKPYNSEEEKELAQNLVDKYGKSPLDFFKVYPDKFYFFSPAGNAFLSFKVSRNLAVVLEDPVCSNQQEMKDIISEFDRYCDENGFVPVFYRVPAESLPVYESLNKSALPIGEEAVLDLVNFTMEGGKMKTTRSAINRLTSEGFVFKVYDPPIKDGLLQKMEQVSLQWLKEMNQKEVAFTQGIFDKNILKNQPVYTIEDTEEKVYAFLNIVPDYKPGEATYDLIRKVSDAPNGVLDMLLAKTFLYLKEKNYKTVNMGLAPMSGIDGINLTEKTIRYAYENIRSFGHFKGLRRYKEKFYPSWFKKYLVYNQNYHLLQVPRGLRKVSEAS